MITKTATTLAYAPPWPYDKIPERLRQCPIHSWRARTGVELIHQEPDIEELHRIIENFKVMPKHMQAESDAKSMELFGVTNMDHAKKLLNSGIYGKTR